MFALKTDTALLNSTLVVTTVALDKLDTDGVRCMAGYTADNAQYTMGTEAGTIKFHATPALPSTLRATRLPRQIPISTAGRVFLRLYCTRLTCIVGRTSPSVSQSAVPLRPVKETVTFRPSLAVMTVLVANQLLPSRPKDAMLVTSTAPKIGCT
jgi:hypothetical protein